MQAIILAAGFGSRLRALTGGGSKALVEVGGRPLILHALETLADHGVGPVLVVTGHEADRVRDVVGDRADTLENTRYAETNSLYSLWMAREWVKGPFLLLNCDLLFDPRILDEVLARKGNCLAYDSTSSRGLEQTKVALRKGRVTDLGKDLPRRSASGESLGLLKFDAEGARALMTAADDLIRAGHEDAWVIQGTRAICHDVVIDGVNVAGYPWTEIDFPYDLDVARRDVWPAISRPRWQQVLRRKRARHAALGVLAASFALAGWVSNTHYRTPDLNWETITPTGVERVTLDRADAGDQKWWRLGRGQTASAVVDSGEVRVYVRLLHGPDTPADARYVLAVTLDEVPVDWRALTSRPDSTVRLASERVGERDRIELTIPAGSHRLGLTLLDGHGEALLVRIRQSERVDEP